MFYKARTPGVSLPPRPELTPGLAQMSACGSWTSSEDRLVMGVASVIERSRAEAEDRRSQMAAGEARYAAAQEMQAAAAERAALQRRRHEALQYALGARRREDGPDDILSAAKSFETYLAALDS